MDRAWIPPLGSVSIREVINRAKERRVGLARALSKLGYCSRSQAVNLIRAGRVKLNGSAKRDPEAPVALHRDRVSVDGRDIEQSEKVYLMMNKPRGFVTTASDEKGRETVYDILKQSGERFLWVAPVGRLDKASEGLLLLTNDSEWGARVADPETHLKKTYHVQIGLVADTVFLKKLVQGVHSYGEVLRVRQARILRSGEKNSWLELVLDEGKNRHIRRMMAAFEVKVIRLMRVSIGPLQLATLAKGTVRALTAAEKGSLDNAMRS